MNNTSFFYSTETSNTNLSYEQINSKYKNHQRRTIDNKITGENKCVGYCNCCLHKGFLTKEIRTKKECISKQCLHYIEKPQSSNKKSIKMFDLEQSIISKANIFLNKFECLKIIHAKLNSEINNEWKLEYITITNEYNINEIYSILSQKLNFPIVLNKLDYNYDLCVKLLFN